MRKIAAGCLGLVALGALVLLGPPVLLLFSSRPDVGGITNRVPVGDTLHLEAGKSRSYGNWLVGGTVRVSSDKNPYKYLYRWRMRAPPQGHPAGEARVDGRGNVVGIKPGIVFLEVGVPGNKVTHQLTILPRIVEFGATPAHLELRPGERRQLKVTIRLEGDVAERWSPSLGFPSKRGDDAKYGRDIVSDHVDLSRQESSPYANEWYLDITGKRPGTTLLYFEVGTSEIAVPITVTASASPGL